MSPPSTRGSSPGERPRQSALESLLKLGWFDALQPSTMAARVVGDWTPSAAWFESLRTPSLTADDLSRPYPFFLAAPVEGKTSANLLEEVALWQCEWKWDGIRAQIVRRGGEVHVWSRGDELITLRFPEIGDAAASLPDGTVIDGEVLAFRDERPLPFSDLQQRIGRQQHVARKARDIPVVFMAYDVLEYERRDVRMAPLSARRIILEDIVRSLRPSTPSPASGELLLPFDNVATDRPPIRVSPLLQPGSFVELEALRQQARANGVEKLMIKRRNSSYGVGRKRGDWWKWKIDPLTIDAVLIYAQPGSGKRA